MKLAAVLLIGTLLAFMMQVTAAPSPRTNDWRPVFGSKMATQKAYINTTTQIVVAGGENSYNYAEILIVSEKPKTRVVNGKTFTALSVVRAMLLECKSAYMAPMADYYFNDGNPQAASKVINIYEHPSAEVAGRVIPKNSPLYNALCPVYI
jgi:hypothetical protein